MKELFLKHKYSFTIFGILIISTVIVACGGNSGKSPTGGSLVEVTPPPTAFVGKNEGGITYTKENLVGTDLNNDGVDDMTADRLNSLFGASSTVVAIFMRSAKLDRDLLSIPDAKLPKTKAEASAIIYSPSRLAISCKEGELLGGNSFEKETLRKYFAVFNTQAKRQRHDEIQSLAGIQTGTFVSCDEILAATTTAQQN